MNNKVLYYVSVILLIIGIFGLIYGLIYYDLVISCFFIVWLTVSYWLYSHQKYTE